jgi:hypothetical protein
MHQRKFVVDDWEPIDQSVAEPVAETERASVFADLKIRHYLVLLSLALLVLFAPIAWVLSGDWSIPLFFVGLALILVSAASLFVPDSPEYELE